MIKYKVSDFPEIWFVYFKSQELPGESPSPICLVAHELRTGRTIKLWKDELTHLLKPPYPIGTDSVLVAYPANKVMSCHLALGWELPARVLDLFAEFRVISNGVPTVCG